ncbi:DUF2793 domain-containing protein [Alkalilacustris brevis]|uniref:DUF2793 domain-containing protein n=1 Tax=Alkalilacustris brevis TaxID=2026338 RepID=UPI000E0DF1C1|nr:DUF2793 domain-containing protein [Alkalilacustris brevis]
MSETTNFALPLVQPAQAQKHVTVNESFARLDALAQLVLQSRSTATPPPTQSEGLVYAVPGGAVNDWGGQAGKVAVFANGGWVFVTPRAGWRAWIADEGVEAVHDGNAWRGSLLALGDYGAGSFFRVLSLEHEVEAGPVSESGVPIPANVMVFAVTARVVEEITGTATGWELGNPGASDRFGSGLGIEEGSFARGLLGAPMAYYAPAPLVLSALGGEFTGGRVRLAVHFYEPGLPGM